MQFSAVIVALAAMAGVVSAAPETVYVYVCSTAVSSGFPSASGVASSTIASTGVVTAPTTTGSPITYATGAASHVTFGMGAGAAALAAFFL